MKLNNMKIGVRLGLGFGAVLLLLVAISMMAISSLGKVNDNMEKIVQLNYAKIKVASDAQKGLRVVVDDIQTMLIRDQSAMKDLTVQIEKHRAEYRELVGKLEKLETSEKGKDLMAQINTAIANAKQANKKVEELCQEGKSVEAMAVFNKEAGPLDDKMFIPFAE